MKHAYLYLAVAIVAEVIATSYLSASNGFTRLMPSVAAALGDAVAFYFLSLTLKTIPTGVAYAIWSGVGIVLISVVAWIFFGQKLDAPAVIGMALIAVGVVVINVFSKTATH
jgi:small multidrug resistance pump